MLSRTLADRRSTTALWRGTGLTLGGLLALPAFLAGLLVGLAECLFFALALARLPIQGIVWQLFGWNATRFIEPVSLGLALVTPVLAGAGFGWLLRQRRPAASALDWWRFALVGPYLLLSNTIGVFVAAAFQPLAQNQDDAGLQLVFRTAFTLASGLAALLCSGAVALTLRLDGAARRTAMVTLATAVSYLAVIMLLDRWPGWHVGGGDMAMPRVAMLANLIAGGIGGVTAFRVLGR